MKIALCQFNMAWEDKEANKNKISEMMEKCSRTDIDWIIFPEMTLSGFTMNTKVSELSDADVEFFRKFAAKHNTWVSFGGVRKNRNKLITLNRKGETANEYSKIHLYKFGGENGYYTAGDQVTSFDLEGITVCPTICFDLRFPYLFWEAAPKVDVFVNIAVWPARRAENYTTLVRARAIENQCYCIGVDRTGTEPFNGKNLEFSGNSSVVDPLGKILLDCGTADGIFVCEADVNKEQVISSRQRFPFYNEKRSDYKRL
jgi:predicted amidohydrolase